jgi:1-phosphofructokinase family hexose kinase
VIIAAGLTPAWQQILRFDLLRRGEVNRAAEAHWCASGKVFNVGIAIAHLGAECRVISPIGADVADRVQEEFAAVGVEAQLIQQGPTTRVCTTLLDEAAGDVTELVENARPLSGDVLARFLRAYAVQAARADIAVLSGSLPANTPPKFYRQLIEQTPGRVVLDARGEELLATLDKRPFFAKPNREELAMTLRCRLDDDESLLSGMQALNERGAEWVVVTEGAKAVWVSSRHEAYRLQPLKVAKVVNPIGCGDCLAAGLAWGLSLHQQPLDCVRIAIAAAAQNAATLLPGRLNPQQALHEAEQVAVEQLR